MMRWHFRRVATCLFLPACVWVASGVLGTLGAQEAKEPPADVTPPGTLTDEPDKEDPPAVPAPSGTPGSSSSSSSAAPAAFAGVMGAVFVVYFMVIGLAILLGLGGLVLSCLAIHDCARRDFPDPNTRAMWCLLLALLRLIGAIIYYFVVYRKNDPPHQHARIPGTPPPSPLSGYGG